MKRLWRINFDLRRRHPHGDKCNTIDFWMFYLVLSTVWRTYLNKICCIRRQGTYFFLFLAHSLFASSSFISCVSVCLVMNFLPLICSDVHLSPWLDEIELPNRRICDVHFRLTLALSFSFSLQPAGRRSMQAEMREEEGKVFLFFFFLSFSLIRA